jgi:hypothetical protein
MPNAQCPAETIAPRQLRCGKTCGKLAQDLWKTILSGWTKFLMRKGWAIEYTNFSTSFPQVVIPRKAD